MKTLRCNTPTCFAGIYARLTAHLDGGEEITGITLGYPADPASQYLAFGAMYDRGLAR
jgi:hypothetical protein